MEEKSAPLTEHLLELRKVLIISFLAIIICSVLSYFLLIDRLMDIIVSPLKNLGEELIFVGVTEGLITQLKVAFFGGIILASPVILWQILSFILPALYSHEKKLFFPVFIIGIILFVAGIVFAYLFVLELGLKMLLIDFSGGLTPMISVSKYVSFIITFLLPFGIVFEIPLITFFLTRIGLISPLFLRKNRRYVILIIFIIAAILTPADILSQVLLAGPMIILYEIGIIISAISYRKRKAKLED